MNKRQKHLRQCRTFLGLAILTVLAMGCSQQSSTDNKPSLEDGQFHPANFQQNGEFSTNLSASNKAALNALDTLQVNSVNLYSTFPSLNHSFYPPDTVLKISGTEFLNAMKRFADKHYQHLDLDRRNELVATAALAQKDYLILYCSIDSKKLNKSDKAYWSGVWIVPNLLGERDLVMIW